jgi:hypothetical protein
MTAQSQTSKGKAVGSNQHSGLKRPVIVPIGPSTAYVQLSKAGLFSLIDAEDVELVGKNNWYENHGYAMRRKCYGTSRCIRLHNEIMSPDEGKYAELCSELECRERQLSQCLSREKSLAEALEKAVSTMAHWISCIKTRPSDEWEAHGSIDFSGCVCGIKEARAALKSYEEEHSGK